MASVNRLLVRRMSRRARHAVGAVVGVGASATTALLFGAVYDDVTRAVVALLMVVPVVVASEIGGRRAGLLTVVAATLALNVTLPPIGKLHIHVRDDLIALVVFTAVSLVVCLLVSTRVENFEAVAEQRRALLRSVSHDLRTPLSTIRAVSTDLRSYADYDTTSRNELLDAVIDETERLDRLVANLLSMSRIEAGTNRIELASVDVAELVEASASRLRRLFARWPLEVDIPEELPAVRADYVHLDQVVTNLLENVTRHTPPGTRVRVSARPLDDGVQIVVADDGPGMSATRRQQNNGLGLAICAAFMAQLTGTMQIDDRPGGGTRVTLWLPRHR
jgi:K+-sensing histidine kinase KdpD